MARSQHPRRNEAGFTLTELMTVVAIIAVLSTVVVAMSGRAYGANARTTSEQVVSAVGLAKLRASSSRRVHRVVIEPNQIAIWQASTMGLATLPTTTWKLVQQYPLARKVKIWDVKSSAITGAGNAVNEDTQLAYDLDIRPDGQAEASTIFLSDGKDHWRVVVYAATAGAYARAQW